MKHYFTINEFRSFVEGGYHLVDVKVGGKTLQLGGAPGLRLSDPELKQVRHHAVLGHVLAVQAIRARGPAGTKVESPRTSGLPSQAARHNAVVRGPHPPAMAMPAGRCRPSGQLQPVFVPQSRHV